MYLGPHAPNAPAMKATAVYASKRYPIHGKCSRNNVTILLTIITYRGDADPNVTSTKENTGKCVAISLLGFQNINALCL